MISLRKSVFTAHFLTVLALPTCSFAISIEEFTLRYANSPANAGNLFAILGSSNSFPPDGTQALLGSGWDSVSSTVMGDCVDRSGTTETIIPKDINGDGQSVVYDAALIDSVSKMRSVLNISASASFSYGIYSGGGKFQLFQDDTINSYSSYMYLSISVLNQTQVLSQKLLRKERQDTLKTNKDDFRKACGDQFVSALSTGGEFSAIVRIESKTEDHQKAVSAAINGAISGFGKASGSVDSQFSSLQSMGKVTIKIIRKGGDGDIPDLKDLNSYAIKFPSRVSANKGKPWIFKAITSSYETVNNLPTGSSPYIYERQNIFLEGLATLRDVALQTRNDLFYAYANPEQFGSVDRKDLQGKIDRVNKHINKILSMANDCKVDPTKKCSGDFPALDEISLPNRTSSPAAEKIKQAEELYELRGDSNKNEAALVILSTIDENTATLDERYHAALLVAQALDWKASRSGAVPATYKDDQVGALRNAISKAVGLAAALPDKPCEADYLSATFIALTEGGKDAWTIVKPKMEALSQRSMRTGVSCKNYVWGGTDRWRAWEKVMQIKNDASESEKERILNEAAPFAEAAYNFEPDYFPNVYVWAGVHKDHAAQCKIIADYVQRSVPSKFQGWEPSISEWKKALKSKDPMMPFNDCSIN